MIDPIGVTPGIVPGGRVEADGAAKVVPLQAVRAAQPAVVAETGAREATKAMAFRPPVNLERVHEIKREIQAGRYPLAPSTIADRMIEAQLRWAEGK